VRPTKPIGSEHISGTKRGGRILIPEHFDIFEEPRNGALSKSGTEFPFLFQPIDAVKSPSVFDQLRALLKGGDPALERNPVRNEKPEFEGHEDFEGPDPSYMVFCRNYPLECEKKVDTAAASIH
jgi:hypothetical protein